MTRRYCVELNFGGARLDGMNTMRHPPGAGHGEEPRGHFFGQSSFATYALVTERNAAKVPEDLPLEMLGPLGCGLGTGAGTVLNALKVGAGSAFEPRAVFGEGEHAAMCGSFTYRSTVLGKQVSAPFSVCARVVDGKCVYFQFMEDTLATTDSFHEGGQWVIRSDPGGRQAII